MQLSDERYADLIKIAKASISHGFLHGAPSLIDPTTMHPDLLIKSRTFVSLKHGTEFRGCIGNIDNVPLFLSVSQNAFKAAFKDGRYPPLTNYWAKKYSVQIYHLHEVVEYEGISLEDLFTKIEPAHSINISYENKNATMLHIMQNVYKNDKRKLVDETVKKAGIPGGISWKNLKFRLYKTCETKPVPCVDIIVPPTSPKASISVVVDNPISYIQI